MAISQQSSVLLPLKSMDASDEIAAMADAFAVAASRYCSLVESASTLNRETLSLEIYRALPGLIWAAVNIPTFDWRDEAEGESACRMTHEQWTDLYNVLRGKLGEWDLYHQTLDPTQDQDAELGSLADDIADIYRDVKSGLADASRFRAVWDWRLLFYSHWGKHATDALQVLHSRLAETLL